MVLSSFTNMMGTPELMARWLKAMQRPNKRCNLQLLIVKSVTVDKEEREIVCGGEQRSLGAIRSMFDEIHKSYPTVIYL